MMNVDSYIDALEEHIAHQGVMSVELGRFAPPINDQNMPTTDRQAILVEMLRVWMEHRWMAGFPVTVNDCLSEFSSDSFSKENIAKLQFEESRQRRSGSNTRSSQRIKDQRNLDELPDPGTEWDDFELLGLLGVGAFSKVYIAKQQGLSGRLVALKLTYRKTQEPQWLATLQHSAIVPVYSVHENNGTYGICMPFLGNTTLLDLLRDSANLDFHSNPRQPLTDPQTILSTLQVRQREIDTLLNSTRRFNSESKLREDHRPTEILPGAKSLVRDESTTQLNSPAAQRLRRCNYVEAVCWIGAQLSDALSYAHAHGVIHSDIKPANVLLGSDGQPRLLDFNVSYARSPDGHVHPEMQLGGTLNYMSPEHRRAMTETQCVDQRSDIYSLGVVLFEMLTGQIPSSNLKYKNARVVNPAVSPAMSAIVAKCLMDAPEDRYQSARELAADLTAQLNHQPLVYQLEPSRKERLIKWSKRHPKLSSNLSIVAASVALIAILGTGFVWRGSALRNADWTHRIDLLQQRLPNSIALVSSLDAAPELEKEAAANFDQTIQWILDHGSATNKVDRRLAEERKKNSELDHHLEQLFWLAKQHPWKPNTIPKLLDLSEVRSIDSDNASTSAMVLQSVRNGDYLGAIATLDQRCRTNPKDYSAWWLLGDCQHAISQLDRAEQAYSICVSLQPEIAVSYLNRGLVRFAKSRYAESLSDYDQLLSIAPSWHWVRLNRALVLQSMGRLQEAVSELDRAVENGYATVSVYRLRADLHQMLGNESAAAADLQLGLHCEPITDQHWVDRGLIQLSSNPINAAKDFQNAIDINPRSIDALQKLAYVYSELLHRIEDAAELCTRLIKLAPWQPTHLAARAVLQARTGKAKGAQEDLAVLEQQKITEPMVMYQIACAYSLLAGKTSEESARMQANQSGMKWFIRSSRSDPNVFSIALTDPDIQQLRDQAEFEHVLHAAKKLELIP